MKHRQTTLSFLLGASLLVGCPQQGGTGTGPAVSISSPASGSPVSGTVAVQVAAGEDSSVSKVQVFARGRGSSGQGASVGSATRSPFVISWYTPAFPNGSELELVAVATDSAGNKGTSDSVPVRVSNSGVPNLSLLVAYTLPPKPSGVGSSSAGDSSLALPPAPLTSGVRPPLGVSKMTRAPSRVRPQADTTRSYALEWNWEPLGSPAVNGYGVYSSTSDLAGPYAQQVRQAAANGNAGLQKYSKNLSDAKPGDVLFGLVTAITGSTTEGGYSNADSAKLLRLQDSASPADGQTISDGRPTLTWTANPEVVGYLYFVSKRPLWESSPGDYVWTNSPQSTEALSVTYPSAEAKLPSGTYHWWAAGVSFDAQGRADAFSFSDSRKLVVP